MYGEPATMERKQEEEHVEKREDEVSRPEARETVF